MPTLPTLMRTVSLVLMVISMAAVSNAQVKNVQPDNRPNPLDDRGGIPVPKNLTDLKNVSLTYWLKFRKTNQRLYNYINEATEFHAYLNVCKRHDLNVTMDMIMRQANLNLQASIPAHYEEPEFALLDPMTKAEQQVFLDDMSSDLYAFEYGNRIALLDAKVAESGKSKKVYCEGIKDEYFKKYVALLATARLKQQQ